VVVGVILKYTMCDWRCALRSLNLSSANEDSIMMGYAA
jgi:hypothetical protein